MEFKDYDKEILNLVAAIYCDLSESNKLNNRHEDLEKIKAIIVAGVVVILDIYK